jgi:hypothetical protein
MLPVSVHIFRDGTKLDEEFEVENGFSSACAWRLCLVDDAAESDSDLADVDGRSRLFLSEIDTSLLGLLIWPGGQTG